MGKRPTELQRVAFENRQEIVRARLSRRDMAKLGLLTAAGFLVTKSGLSHPRGSPIGDDGWGGGGSGWGGQGGGCAPGLSPPTTPFVEPLPILPVLPSVPLTSLSPAPSVCPKSAIDPLTGLPFEGRGQFNGVFQPGKDCFQFFDRFPPQKYFLTRMKATSLSVSPDLPLQTLWGFDLGNDKPAIAPGPTIVSRYGEPILIRRLNALPPEGQNGGFGIPSVSTHLHNFHTAAESDGSPCRYFERGQYFDYHYTMALAGFDSTHAPNGDPNEALSTLWYHDHRIDNTAQNAYKGLTGFHLIFNDFDTGDEFTGFRLPSFPEFDVPLVLGDKLFDPSTGLLCFDLFNFDGLIGDKFLVNGKIQPFFEVFKRRYRFRLLNTGPARFYELFLTDPNHPSTPIPFWVIANDGNLLPRPVQVTSTRISVAERIDIIVDFAKLPNNPSILYLENRLEQNNGRGPTDKILPAGKGDKLMELRVGPAIADLSVDPATLPKFYSLPSKTATPLVTRTFRFERKNGQWAINDRFMNCNEIRFRVKRNSVERWILENKSFGSFFSWQHPIHTHLEEFQILKRNGSAPGTSSVENSRKDVVRLGPTDKVELFFRFRDMRGDYPMHCHNTVHEDHAMMLLWQVDDEGDKKSTP